MALHQGAGRSRIQSARKRIQLQPDIRQMDCNHRRQRQCQPLRPTAEPGPQQFGQLLVAEGTRIGDAGRAGEQGDDAVEPRTDALCRRLLWLRHLHGEGQRGALLPMLGERCRADPAAERQRGKKCHRSHQERQHAVGDGAAQAKLIETSGPQ